MWFDIAMLVISLGVILVSAGFFTNGVEWLGVKLNLSEGAVGSILAAVGTAMPETLIPIIAIVLGQGEMGHEIGVGAILGAPFMLGTLALFISGTAVMSFRHRRAENYPRLEPDPNIIKRDLSFFLWVYTVAIVAAFLPRPVKLLVALILVLAYLYFAYKTLTSGEEYSEDHEMDPLLLARKSINPPTVLVVFQVLLAFAGITIGAKYFVDGVTELSNVLGIPAFIFSLLIAPVATEMPEKFNSVIWLSQRKDTIALGNITGAMVFQSSIIPAIGIALTPWVLSGAALLSAALAIMSALFTYSFIKWKGHLDARLLLAYGGVFYAVFIGAVIMGVVK